MDNKLTTEQFGASVRLKYPEYAKFSNKEIAQRVITKFPKYAERISDLEQPKEKGIFRKVGDFLTSSTQKFATSLGQARASGGVIDKLSETEQQASDVELNLTKRINENKKLGRDSSRLEKELITLQGRQSIGKQVSDIVPVVDKSNKQIIGEGLGTVVEAASGGIFKGVKGARFARYIAPSSAVQKAEKAKFLAKPLSGRLSQIGKDVAKDLAISTPIGYTIDVSQKLQEDKSGAEIFKPGLGTLISSVIPIGIGSVRAGRQIVGDFGGKVLLPNLSGVESKAYDRLKTGGAKEFMGRTTPESVLNDARTSASAFKKTMYDEFGKGKEAIISEFTGKRIGIDEKTGTTLRKVAERFGFEDRLPQNVSNMSAKETMDLLAEINKVKPVTDIDDPLVRNLKFALQEVKSEVMNRAKKEFGGKGGSFEKIYSSYATKSEGLKNIQAIIGKVGVNAKSKKLNPIQQKTAINRLQAAFKENADGYIEAIKVIEDETGERILDKIAASQLSPVLPKTLRSAPQGPLGVLNDIISAMTIPLSSPRIGSWLLSKVGGYGEGVASKILNSNPAIRKAIYDAVNKENMAFSDAVELYAKEYIKKPRLGLSVEDVSGEVFNGFPDLTTKVLKKIEGRRTTSKQFISDLTNSPDLKQSERDLVRNLLNGEGDQINVKDFANKVKTELLPLKRVGPGDDFMSGKAIMGKGGEFENVTLPSELRGPVANYQEHIYESPIKTSAGSKHFRGFPENYFAHSRIEDVYNNQDLLDYKADKLKGFDNMRQDTRRVIEIQSDLFQKGGLEGEAFNDSAASVLPSAERQRVSYLEKKIMDIENPNNILGVEPYADELAEMKAERDVLMKKANSLREKAVSSRSAELSKLEPYRNTWHERVIREEVKQAAQDGKTKLQFPTGETAMKIEGLGDRNTFQIGGGTRDLRPEDLKVGFQVRTNGDEWIVTDVLGDGKFKAIPREIIDASEEQLAEMGYLFPDDAIKAISEGKKDIMDVYSHNIEQFDISGKVDTNNPIYKFYEKEVGRYLSNKYGAKRIKDAQGVDWYEVDVKKDMAKLPIEAFGVAPLAIIGNEDEK